MLFVALAVRLPHLPKPGFSIDQRQFVLWSMQSVRQGLAAPYSEIPGSRPARRWCNYPPAYLHVLHGVGRVAIACCSDTRSGAAAAADRTLDDYIAGRPAACEAAINALYKLPAVVADLLTIALLFRWILPQSRQAALIVAGMMAISPALWWNSAAWGQVDSIHTLLMLLSLHAAMRGRHSHMCAWAMLAVLTKAQSLMLAPIWVACLLRPFAAKPMLTWPEQARELLRALLAAVATAALVAGPVGAAGGGSGAWDSLVGAVGRFPFTHLNGFSMWFLVDPLERSMLGASADAYRIDTQFAAGSVVGVLGIAPRAIGLLALAAIALAVFVSVLRRPGVVSIHNAARVLPLAFFMLPTQIHERYLFPTIALWAWTYSANRGDGRRWRGASWWGGWLMVHALVFVNAAWVFPGPAGSAWTEAVDAALHISPLARPMGWWCAVAGLALFLVQATAGLVGFTLGNKTPSAVGEASATLPDRAARR